MNEIWDRLRERKLVQWAVAYVAAAFALLQGVDIVAQRFGWPESITRGLIIASCIGFVVTLLLAWYHGERGAQKVSGAELLILSLVLLVGGGFLWRFGPVHAPADAGAPRADVGAAPGDGKSIAVLPFENLSDDKANQYFVSGMQDMILTSLAKIGGLKVISRTSTEKYASQPDNLRQVGAELGVAHILEGSVQRVGDQVLINLQLIDVRDDTHLWAETFDRRVEDVFSVEREVADLVAQALRAQLLPADRAALAQAPTRNRQAYDLFLQAEYQVREASIGSDPELMRAAVAKYRAAIDADGSFALAWAKLARAISLLYWTTAGAEESKALPGQAREAARRAQALAPESADARLAMAELQYRMDLDYTGALASFDAVLAQRPNDATAHNGRGFSLRRLGRFEEASAAFAAAMAVDPRYSEPSTNRGITDFLAGALDRAEADLRHSLQINPNDWTARRWLSELMLYRGDPAQDALAIVSGDDSAFATRSQLNVLLRTGQFDRAMSVLRRMPESLEPDQRIANLSWQALALSGREQEARQALQGRIEGMRTRVASLPENSGSGQAARFELARAEALLGNTQRALELVKQGLALLPPEKDMANGTIGLGIAAQVYGQMGRTDLLLPMLARIRSLEGTDTNTSAATLRTNPTFNKVRDDPRFQAEIARFEAAGKP